MTATNLALVVELLAFRWAQQRLLMAGEGARETDEEGGVGGGGLPVLVFFVAVRVVHADADDLLRSRNWDFVVDLPDREVRRQPRALIRQRYQRCVFDHLAQRRPACPVTGGKV